MVDKGQPDRIVSFCGQGIQQISATQVELRAADFTPTQDLEILILGPKVKHFGGPQLFFEIERLDAAVDDCPDFRPSSATRAKT